MKRSYSDMIPILTQLPDLEPNNLAAFKSSLNGHYNLRVTQIVDISKPADKPVEEIDEPEDNDVAVQNQLSKSNARMIQLNLKDSKDADISALETERIELLSNVKLNSIITIAGPVEVRCRNIMLERKHVISIEDPPQDLQPHLSNVGNQPTPKEEPKHVINTINLVRNNPAHVPSVSNLPKADPIQMIDLIGQIKEEPHRPKSEIRQPIQVIQLEDEDWEDWDENEDDCIILD